MIRNFIRLALLLAIASEVATRAQLAAAFTTPVPLAPYVCIGKRNFEEYPLRQCIYRGHELYSTPPPLSPLSEKDDSNFDNYTPDEISKMKDVMESLSLESDDQTRRLRLQTIMDVGLSGPNGGPKRFAVLFEKVLMELGEQVQKEAREKFSEQAASTEGAEEENADTESEQEDASEEEKPAEKSPEELKLWALVDMMVQSKTAIKKHKF